jgi:hypothetical protein
VTGRTPRQWLEVVDDDDDYWLIDMTFMLSTYRCTFGDGCPGGWGAESYSGCCATAPFFDDDEDPHRLQQYVDRLKPEHTDNYDEIHKRWLIERTNDTQLRKLNGYCIFFNKGAADGTIGCSLHAEAVRVGEDWRDWKPNICWTVPIRVDEEGNYNTLTAWDRDEHGGWGQKGDGSEGFWCIDDQANYPAVGVRVYESLSNEITRILGADAYKKVAEHCEAQMLMEESREASLLGISVDRSVPVSIRQKEEADAGDASQHGR